jgi:glycosyltransferase involved in cell wall biosynthesis
MNPSRPAPRVAVVTPTHRTPTHWLRQCADSVAAQSHRCLHIVVADGAPASGLEASSALQVVLPENCGDFGDTPRAVGSFYPAGLGCDAVAYLDADNWYDPDHIASLVALQGESGAAIVTSRRRLHRLDGSYMAECTGSDGEQFSDTNCLLLWRPAFRLFAVWALMPRSLHALDDRVIWLNALKSGLPRAHTGRATVAYRAGHAGFYAGVGETPPAEASDSPAIASALAQWRAKGYPELAVKWGYRNYRPRTAA